ncbi:MAG: cytochrome c [Solibacillus sp.]
MKKSLLTLIFGSALFLAACGGDDKEQSTGSETAAPNGEKIVMQSCTTCHGGKLQGSGAPALDKLGAKYSEQEILDIIINGTDKGMPPSLIKGADAEAAAKYLAGLK